MAEDTTMTSKMTESISASEPLSTELYCSAHTSSWQPSTASCPDAANVAARPATVTASAPKTIRAVKSILPQSSAAPQSDSLPPPSLNFSSTKSKTALISPSTQMASSGHTVNSCITNSNTTSTAAANSDERKQLVPPALQRLAQGSLETVPIAIPEALMHNTGLADFLSLKGGYTYGPIALAAAIVGFNGRKMADMHRAANNPHFKLPYVVQYPTPAITEASSNTNTSAAAAAAATPTTTTAVTTDQIPRRPIYISFKPK